MFDVCFNHLFVSQSEVTGDDLFSFLMHFRADESLCRGTELWNEVCSRHAQNVFESFITEIARTNCYLIYL